MQMFTCKAEGEGLVLVTRLDRLSSDTAEIIKLIKKFDKADIVIRLLRNDSALKTLWGNDVVAK
jgi:DNA invertase Pin-like site-specific DNA recombinase